MDRTLCRGARGRDRRRSQLGSGGGKTGTHIQKLIEKRLWRGEPSGWGKPRWEWSAPGETAAALCIGHPGTGEGEAKRRTDRHSRQSYYVIRSGKKGRTFGKKGVILGRESSAKKGQCSAWGKRAVLTAEISRPRGERKTAVKESASDSASHTKEEPGGKSIFREEDRAATKQVKSI